MRATRLWCLLMLLGGIGAGYAFGTLHAATIAATRGPHNFVGITTFFAMIVCGFISGGGFYGLLMSLGVEPAEGGRFRPKQTLLGRWVKFTAGDAERYCAATVKFGAGTSAVLIVLTGLITWIYLGMPFSINYEALWGMAKVMGGIVAVMVAVLALVAFANWSPRVGGSIAAVVFAGAAGFMIWEVFIRGWDAQVARESAEGVLAFLTVGASVAVLYLFVRYFPGLYPLVCPAQAQEVG